MIVEDVSVRVTVSAKHPMLRSMKKFNTSVLETTLVTSPARGSDNPGEGGGDDDGTGLITKTKVKTKKPSLYRVVILNDDYTPMEFVVFILERLFNKNAQEAYNIMLHVHNHGVGICGIYTYEVAETKVAQVRDLAQRNEHPLRCDLERED